MNVSFFIPAGGEGQRLRPLTTTVPKPLLPVRVREDGTLERIIDTPVSLGREFGSSLIVSGSYRSDQIGQYFAKAADVQIVHDNGIVNIGGSMLQHRRQLFAGRPDAVAMIPGDHYLQTSSLARMINTLSGTGADVVILGSWIRSYHEEYGVQTTNGKGNFLTIPNLADRVISALGTCVINADWLAKRLEALSVEPRLSCDLTSEVIFGKDQASLPRIAFEPLEDGEYWEDVGTVARLYRHIRHFHPRNSLDEQGNVNLADTPVAGRATSSVIYFGTSKYEGGHVDSFIANDLIKQCT